MPRDTSDHHHTPPGALLNSASSVLINSPKTVEFGITAYIYADHSAIIEAIDHIL
jgi:hypothetical protein